MNAIVKAPLTGEILAPEQMLVVSAAMHPLRMEARTVLVLAGSSVAEIVEACERECEVSRLAAGADVKIDGEIVPRDMWGKVRVKRGHVLVRAVAGKGVGSILKAVFSIGLLVLGSVLTAGGLSPFLVGVITAGVGLVGTLALNALFPPASTKADVPKTVYSIGGPRNEVSKWEPIPVVLGDVRMAGKYAAAPYTEFVGDEQFVRGVIVWGVGPLDISELKFGETLVSDYDDVELQTLSGYPGETQTLYPGQVVPDSMSVQITKKDSPIKRSTAEDAIEIQFDLVAEAGIYNLNKKKGTKDRLVVKGSAILYQYGTQNVVATIPWDMSDNDADPKRETYRFTGLPGNAQYDLAIVRDTQDYDDDEQDDIADNITLTAIRTFRNAPATSFEIPVAMTAFRIRATKQLNGVPDNFTARVKTIGRSWNGTAWVDGQRPRNPGDLGRLVLQGPGNRRARSDAQVDLLALQAFADRCRAKGFTFDMVRDFRASVFETLRDVFAAGRGVPILRDGKWSVAWETSDAPIVQHLTSRNTWGFKRRQTFSRKPHALRVKYQDRDKGWIEDERLVFNDGFTKSNATLTEQVEFPGVTERGLVQKHGRYRLAEFEQRPAIITVSVDIEHLRFNKGDRVYLAVPDLLISQSDFRVRAVNGQMVTLDTPVTMVAGENYAAQFRLRGGTSLIREVITQEGVHDTITLVGNGAVPSAGNGRSAGDLGSFGPAGKAAGVYRVKEIRSGQDLSAEVDLVDDAPAIEYADTQPIPEYDSGIVAPIDPATLAPYGLKVTERTEVSGGVPTYIASVLWQTYTKATISYFIVEATSQYGRVLRADPTTLQTSFANLSPGRWTFRVRSVLTNGRLSAWSEPLLKSIAGQYRSAPDPVNFAVSPLGDVANLTWDQPDEPVAASEIRYTPATSGAEWASAVPIATGLLGLSAQVPFQSGTYLLKHISYGGIYSAAAASIVITNAGLIARNVVEEVFEMAPFTGDHQGTEQVDATLRLAAAFDPFSVPDIFAYGDAFLGDKGYMATGTYTLPDVTDLGEVHTSRLTAEVVAQGLNSLADVFGYPDIFAVDDVFGVEPSDWTVDVQVSTTTGDPAQGDWSDWSRLIMGDYTARAFRFRLVLAATAFGVTPEVSLLHVTIDMPDRIDAGRDVIVPTAGKRVSFAPPFRVVDGLSRSDQNLQPGDRAIVTNLGPTGFDISFQNSSGQAVQRTFDWVAKGYGRRII
ncbi:hypothetical protein GCM10011390_41570 [Aureimonas endophytica]|uniref:Tail protein n=1 Tax=Aureimonas endophytica TaxID=2027858 RepID=A0A916ZXQ6_9HYPH|nr:phage tail protein [Aureimonas endophytica]GGE18070.1 hypothetical protein GCM10011390_41570 [Aureimonas endophytica]